ncbi:MAG: hypothetical protein LBR77_08305 [Lachnospiraceae bacterium]|nr:hypothetical protein [Lachnospiraceae bacterium]
METILGGILFLAIFAGIFWFWLAAGNMSAKKFKNNNPDAATIWIIGQRYIGVDIRKVDGKKPKKFGYGLITSPGGIYLLPGSHVLYIEHGNMDPAVYKDPEYKKIKFSEMGIAVEAGKDYILEYNEHPGQYALVEGKPEGK